MNTSFGDVNSRDETYTWGKNVYTGVQDVYTSRMRLAHLVVVHKKCTLGDMYTSRLRCEQLGARGVHQWGRCVHQGMRQD